MVFLDQANGQDVSYYLGVIAYRNRMSGEVTNVFGVCHSCITMDM